MKKSDHYRYAQLAVLRSDTICNADKLAIIHTLQADEDLEKFRDKQEADKEASK